MDNYITNLNNNWLMYKKLLIKQNIKLMDNILAY